ncbi:MAG: sphingosine/diacylglycerol kinase-related protein [Deltaproteobacteria bacterium]|nr:sphingosine/diacylglycerol kinase-related protein [Deltaproteobacteria bacterium]
MRIKVIANPTAGRGGKKAIEKVIEYMKGKGAEVDLFLTRKRGDALQTASDARNENVDIVVGAGGDGTINEIINGLAGSDIPLGVIPLGTVNVFALETGIPMDPVGACNIILEGLPRKLNLGRVNGRYFLLMGGVGFDAYVVYGLDIRLKRLSGRISYILTALGRGLTYRSSPLEIELDNGQKVNGYGAVVGNMKYYGGTMSITPFADMERNDLDVCIFKSKGFGNILRYTWGVIQKRHLTYPDVEYHTVKNLRIKSKGKTYIQADGDVVGQLPAEFSIAEEGITVILPKEV